MHSEKSRRIKKKWELKICSVIFKKNNLIGEQKGRQFMLQFLEVGFMNLSQLDSNTDSSQTTQPETDNS